MIFVAKETYLEIIFTVFQLVESLSIITHSSKSSNIEIQLLSFIFPFNLFFLCVWEESKYRIFRNKFFYCHWSRQRSVVYFNNQHSSPSRDILTDFYCSPFPNPPLVDLNLAHFANTNLHPTLTNFHWTLSAGNLTFLCSQVVAGKWFIIISDIAFSQVLLFLCIDFPHWLAFPLSAGTQLPDTA